jgi:hypothetical protein
MKLNNFVCKLKLIDNSLNLNKHKKEILVVFTLLDGGSGLLISLLLLFKVLIMELNNSNVH